MHQNKHTNDLGYVSVSDLIEYANNHVAGIDANDIARFPRADVQEVKHAKWIGDRENFGTYVCSNCYKVPPYDEGLKLFDYCPYCGAKMDGKESEE